jgi:hypothetical protein
LQVGDGDRGALLEQLMAKLMYCAPQIQVFCVLYSVR